NPGKVKPTHISLYLFLLNQNNRLMWVEWFKCPFDLAMQGSCIGSKSTYYRNLKELQNFGLIEYKEGLNNYKAPLIRLICLYKNEPLTEQVSVPLSEPLTEQASVQLTGNIYKHITDNSKLKDIHIKKIFDFFETLEETEIERCIKNLHLTKTSKNHNEKFNKPSLEEIEEYCFLRNNKVDPQKFYDFYEGKGWMVGKNKMKDWKACVRTWEKNEN